MNIEEFEDTMDSMGFDIEKDIQELLQPLENKDLYKDYSHGEMYEREAIFLQNPPDFTSTTNQWIHEQISFMDLFRLFKTAFKKKLITDTQFVEIMSYYHRVGYTEDGRAFQEYEDGSIDWFDIEPNPKSLIEVLIEDKEKILK
jgi:hypothetical protein